MADYRVYCLDGEGAIALADWIEARNDDEAISKARRFKDGALRCELWLKDRLVAKLNPAGRLELLEY